MELHSITKFTADSRADNHVVCYSDVWSKNNFKTWKDFLTDITAFCNILGYIKILSFTAKITGIFFVPLLPSCSVRKLFM